MIPWISWEMETTVDAATLLLCVHFSIQHTAMNLLSRVVLVVALGLVQGLRSSHASGGYNSLTVRPPTLLSPVVPHSSPREAPVASISVESASVSSPVVEDLNFPRTEIHVLEKCCPYATHYAVRKYPSALEAEQGWLPALTFHAFEFNASLLNCWRIVNATAKDPLAPPGSQLWDVVPPGKSPADPATAFCLPKSPRLPQSFFYVAAVKRRASFVTEPLTNVSQRLFDEFALPGWSATTTPAPSAKPTPAPTSQADSRQRLADFTPIYPLAYYYWRPQLPVNVIADIRLQVSESRATVVCPVGYEKARGNLNFNFALDPYVAFCVKIVPKRLLNPLLSVPRKYTEGKYVTDIKIKPRDPGLVNERRKNATQDVADCLPPWEPMATTLDAWDHRGVAERQATVLRQLNRTFEVFNLTSELSVFTGYGEWLSFCMIKEELYLPNAELRDLSEFVERIFVDQTQIARKNRLTTVYNARSPHPMKIAPQGRLKYVKAETVSDHSQDQRKSH